MNRVQVPSLNRRTVITGLCASGLVGACSAARPTPPPTPQAKAAAQGQALATGEMDRWAAKVGTEFNAMGFRLTLAGVQPLQSTGVRPASVARHGAFLVVFDVIAGGQMPGDLIYAMRAPGVGPLDIFIASAATSQFPNRMDAVFN
jgi:hypothetical protein